MKPFFIESRTFGLGQTNWTDKFWGIWGIFGQTISTHLRTVSPLFMFSIIQPLFLQEKSKIFIRDWNFNLGRKEWRMVLKKYMLGNVWISCNILKSSTIYLSSSFAFVTTHLCFLLILLHETPYLTEDLPTLYT